MNVEGKRQGRFQQRFSGDLSRATGAPSGACGRRFGWGLNWCLKGRLPALPTKRSIVENKVVKMMRASLEEMWKPGKPMSQGYESSPNEWMGLSFFVLDRGGVRILGHTGSQAGFRSFYYFNPVTKAAVIAVFNTTNEIAPASSAQRRVQEMALTLLRE